MLLSTKVVLTMLLTTGISRAQALIADPTPTNPTNPTNQQVHDPGVRSGPPGAGGALTGLTAAESSAFTSGLATFQEIDDVPHGLGPRFNLDSCSGCHAFPAPGG